MAYGHFRCIRFKRKNVVGETGIGAFLDRYISLKAHGVDLAADGLAKLSHVADFRHWLRPNSGALRACG